MFIYLASFNSQSVAKTYWTILTICAPLACRNFHCNCQLRDTPRKLVQFLEILISWF